MVRLFFFFWQGVKGLAFEPNQLQGVYLSLMHVLVLIKSSWANIVDSELKTGGNASEFVIPGRETTHFFLLKTPPELRYFTNLKK